MKKNVLALALTPTIAFAISSSCMASEIICTGVNSEAKIVLGLTDKFFPVDKAEYTYGNKEIPTAGYEAGIHSNLPTGTQKFVYKFKTLKKHPLAKKNSNLVLTIRQNTTDPEAYIFTLEQKHSAALSVEGQESTKVLDTMTCEKI